ncbi:Hypp7336 [Branchiostoma lanceolatum]|uniref:Hypp7336 protein n=1 Tax=Branchiostoma lanceolatum TaxID=7740 RepID=A0A8J9YZM0_BRALA|nr:Hypp7336 [Branchiostoma lanceolatum]
MSAFAPFWKRLALVCPQLVGRELYLDFLGAGPERKFVLLSGGKILDCPSGVTFYSRKKWFTRLVKAVPMLKKKNATFLTYNSYTLPGRSGWRMDKVMKYLKMNEGKTIDVEMFFRPPPSTQELQQLRIERKKQRFPAFLEELVEACPQLVGRELYLNVGHPESEQKFVLLSGGKIQDCRIGAIFDTRQAWVKNVVDTIPEIKEIVSVACTSLSKCSYTLPGRGGWKMINVMKYLRNNGDKTINAEMFFQPRTQKLQRVEKKYANIWEELADTCPQLVGRKLFLNVRRPEFEQKFVLLSGGKIQDCRTGVIFDGRQDWLKNTGLNKYGCPIARGK